MKNLPDEVTINIQKIGNLKNLIVSCNKYLNHDMIIN
jgi:hypothetical protein